MHRQTGRETGEEDTCCQHKQLSDASIHTERKRVMNLRIIFLHNELSSPGSARALHFTDSEIKENILERNLNMAEKTPVQKPLK